MVIKNAALNLLEMFLCSVKGIWHIQACSLTALVHHWFSHSKHKCDGRPDVCGRDQCPVVTGWMGHNIALSERTPTSRAGLLFKSSGRSHSMCTSPLRHGEQWDACTRPLLAYCRAGLLRPLGCLIKSETITFAGLSGRDACKKKKINKRLQHQSYPSPTALKYHH